MSNTFFQNTNFNEFDVAICKIVSNGPVRQTLWDLATTVLEGPGGNTELPLPVSCPCKPD